MHEWLIAEGIAKIIKERNLGKVRIRLGRLQGIDKEILISAIKQLTQAEIEVVEEEAELRCLSCGERWKPRLTGKEDEGIHFLPEVIFSIEKCPKCGSRDFEIVRGRGIWIEY